MNPSCPIPAREGISPRKIVLRGQVPDAPVFYAGRAGDSPYEFGELIPAGTQLTGPVLAWFHPDVPAEASIPFQESVVEQVAGLVVVDKPAFVPATTNGRI